MKPRIKKKELIHNRPPREGMSGAYLILIRGLPCVICGRLPVEAHHLLRTGERGLSRKSSDRWAIPLCPECHRALHGHGDEEAFLMEFRVDGRAIASALWASRDSFAGMARVCNRHLLDRFSRG